MNDMTIREVLALCDDLEANAAHLLELVDMPSLQKQITRAVALLRDYVEGDYTAAIGTPVIHERQEVGNE